MVGKTALNKERYHLNGGPFQTYFALLFIMGWKGTPFRGYLSLL